MPVIKRYQPTILEDRLYTVSRAARILKIKPSKIEFVEALNPTECLVSLWTDLVKIDKRKFIKLLSEDRQSRAKGLEVVYSSLVPNLFVVSNPDKETTYAVECHRTHIRCCCRDYENLVNDFGNRKVACKHVYAVLAELNYKNLSEYLVEQKKQFHKPKDGKDFYFRQDYR